MLRLIGLLIALGFGCCGPFATASQNVAGQPPLRHGRVAASDLEVTRTMPGVPHDESRFVTRAFLLGLPRVTVHVASNEDFPAIMKPGVMVSGVYLDVLAAHLGAHVVKPSAVEAICADGYAAAFPAGYIWIHRPILVLTIDGLSPHEWSAKNHGYDAGPYFIAYEHFVPHFQVLSHEDRPLEPDQVNKLRFTTKEILYAGIAPKEDRDPAELKSPVMSGYRIARQNCFRCHNSGEFGGSQSGLSWKKLEKIAHDRPDYFAAWVYDPRTIDPTSKMPANRDYDKPTLDALTKYFSVLATESD